MTYDYEERLDYFLIECDSIPLSEVRRQISQGFCRVDGLVISNAEHKVRAGSVVSLGQTKIYKVL